MGLYGIGSSVTLKAQFDRGTQNVPIPLKGPTGFDSETNWNVSMSSAG